jgi:hypothetical protein
MVERMTRAEYEAKYGVSPKAIPQSTLDVTPAPIRMTRAEYEQMYNPQKPEPGLVNRLGERTKDFAKDMTTETRGFGAMALRTAGFVTGAANDVIGAAISPVIEKTADAISESKAVQDIATSPTVSKGLDAVDAAGQRFGRGMDNLETNNPQLAQDVKDLGNVTSFLPVGAGTAKVATKARGAYVAANADNITTKIEEEIFNIENNYAKTRTANEYSKDAGAASRKRLAETDVLRDAVDADGTIRTKQPGGAVDQYRKQTIEGKENVVRENLVQNAERVPFDEVRFALVREVASSGLEGADLVSALKGIERELEGLRLRSSLQDAIDVYKIHDAKVGTTKNINYMTPPETATYRKAVARAYKKVVERGSTKFDVREVNTELAKYYEDIKRLENLDGRKVKGGRLGKYFAQVTGNIVGGAAGSVGGPAGAAIGSIVGGEVAGALKGAAMKSKFSTDRGAVAPKNPVLERARLSVADKAIDVPSTITKTPEIARLEKDIKKNVSQQEKAIEQAKKTGDFSAVQALKDIYKVLVEELKKLIEGIRNDQGGSANFFGDRDQSYKRGSRKTTYQAMNAQNNTQSIDSTVARQGDDAIEVSPDNIRQSTDATTPAKSGEWTGTPSSKQSTAGDMSISKKPIERGDVSVQKTDTSGGFGGEYLYHGTTDGNLDAIAKEGLKPMRRGMLSLSKTENYSRTFAKTPDFYKEQKDGVMFRVKADYLKGKTVKTNKPRPQSDIDNEILTKETIPPEAIEILKDGKWQPLKPSPLTAEARKYKSAEEFVKAQGTPVYHGGGKIFETLDEINFDEGFYMLKKTNADLEELKNIPKGSYYSASDLAKMPAEAFGGKVTDFVVNFKKPLVYNAKGKGWAELADGEMSDFTARLVSKAKRQGNDGVIIKNIREGFSSKGTLGEEAGLVDDYIALDKNTVKTRSQLTDIWNKANGE